ncbi:hypothetical protein AVEN_227143-1 [Araneus ventricosus]|uniref:Uncharacterized protein n=1 Tax=Araneus ventricosus TaxID=182803 RepID=A0A4Y2BUN6_ARAVE|nr:hypothetical protein AVEN_227143-1 [Araneus ventricosus]
MASISDVCALFSAMIGRSMRRSNTRPHLFLYWGVCLCLMNVATANFGLVEIALPVVVEMNSIDKGKSGDDIFPKILRQSLVVD